MFDQRIQQWDKELAGIHKEIWDPEMAGIYRK